MTSPVTVTTGARLHCGMLALPEGHGRRFGGVGIMIDRPGCELTFRRGPRDVVTGEPAAADRVAAWLRTCRAESPELPLMEIDVRRAVPAHAGLGSGTQLGLAFAQGVTELAGRPPEHVEQLAQRLGRGRRSALGIHGFRVGGLLVEGGKQDSAQLSPLVARLPIPDAWRFVLIRPPAATGLAGEAESRAFADLGPMSDAMTARLCRIVLLELLPAVAEGDAAACGEALYQFGLLNGDYFAPAQQGRRFADPRMNQLVTKLRADGIPGLVQSSWGPTLVCLCPDDPAARQLASDLRQGPWSDCLLEIAAPLNTGATVSRSA